MDTTGGDAIPEFNFLVDPFKGKIQVLGETGPFLEFENVEELRRFCCRLIEGANKLENRLLIGEGKAPARKAISGRYSKKAIKEWESQIQESGMDWPVDGDCGENGDASS